MFTRRPEERDARPDRRVRMGALILGIAIAAGCAQDRPSGPGPAPPSGEATDSAQATFLLQRGRSDLAEGRTEDAVRNLERARALNPHSAEIALSLARAYRFQGRYVAAAKAVDEILASADSTENDRRGAREIRVEILLDEGDLAAARKSADELLGGGQASSSSRRLAGIIAYREGDLVRAISLLQEAARQDPADAETRTALGVALLQNGDLDGAASALEEAVKRDPGSQSAVTNLAKVYERQGRREEAERTRSRAREILDTKAVGKKAAPLRTEGVEAYNAGRFSEALEKFQAVLRIIPGDSQALAHAGSCLLALQREGEAEDYLKRAVQARPENDFAWTEMGRLRALRNDLPGAIEMFERAARANPYAPEPHYFLAGIYYSQRRREDFERERAAYEKLRGAGASLMPLPGENRR